MRSALLLLALTVAGAGCATGAGATPNGRLAEPTIPPSTTAPAPPLAVLARVEAAYRRSWAVYTDAVSRVDASHLAEAFGDGALRLRRRDVEALRRAGEAIAVRVAHRLDVTLVDAETAVVTDVLDNHMVRVDARTGRALEPDPNGTITRAYTLRREGGTWKVTDAVALG
jgi:hypothetical protein